MKSWERSCITCWPSGTVEVSEVTDVFRGRAITHRQLLEDTVAITEHCHRYHTGSIGS